MRPHAPILLLIASLLPASGCAVDHGAEGTSSPQRYSWVTHHGGAVNDAHSARLAAAGARLQPGLLHANLSFQVLASPIPSANSRRDGSIYVTVGLIDMLDDDQLAAAVAHEIGHLVDSGDVAAVTPFAVTGPLPDVERRADAYGVSLLASCHIPVTAMRIMLTALARHPTTTVQTAAALDERAHTLMDRTP